MTVAASEIKATDQAVTRGDRLYQSVATGTKLGHTKLKSDPNPGQERDCRAKIKLIIINYSLKYLVSRL